MNRKILITIAASISLMMFFACSQGTKAKLIIDVERMYFVFVDAKSGSVLLCKKLIINGKEVVDAHITTALGMKSVVFATEEGEIVRDGNSVTFKSEGYTENTIFRYRLENDVLTILGTAK
jgi:hypothetical protein